MQNGNLINDLLTFWVVFPSLKTTLGKTEAPFTVPYTIWHV